MAVHRISRRILLRRGALYFVFNKLSFISDAIGEVRPVIRRLPGKPRRALFNLDDCAQTPSAISKGANLARVASANASSSLTSLSCLMFTEVSSSTTDGEMLNGGDSGFQELPGCSDKSPASTSSSAGSEQLLAPPSPDEEMILRDAEELAAQEMMNTSSSVQDIVPDASHPYLAHHDPVASSSTTREEHLPGNSSWEHLPGKSFPETSEEVKDDDAASDVSDISGFSNMSGADWKATSGPVSWVQQQISFGTSPRDILTELLPNASISPNVDNITLWRLIVSMLSEPPKRKKLPNVNSLDDVVGLIRRSKRIVVLTGAGVSVSCGIPDFRSRDGIYARLSKDFPDLPDPQAMFDIHYFKRDPRPFFKFAKEIYPGQFEPSPSHKFIRLLETHGKLMRNYTQNIDTLEKTAGIDKVITCHGSFATASCTRCKHQVDSSVIREVSFRARHCLPGLIVLDLRTSSHSAFQAAIFARRSTRRVRFKARWPS